jgi:uncharacterized protein (DUF849 family)
LVSDSLAVLSDSNQNPNGVGVMSKVWIEAALNGAWSRALQPGIPSTIEAIIAEGVACARAGASIIHTHAYDHGGLPGG